jgi:mRNA-degrading endonuclease RelE of RelBE toxin-antitoxin system
VKKIFNEVKSLPEFDKDLKILNKKFKTLKDDLDIFTEKQLRLFHKLGIDNKGIVQISNIGIEYPKIYKARKFACRALKGKGSASGIRVIYAYFEDEDCVEFIEIYYKGDKANEERERILRNYSKGG